MPERNIYLESLFDSPQRLTQVFGVNPQIYKQFGMRGHNGIDYVAPNGTVVYPILKGAVEYKDDGTGYGKHIRIFTNTGDKTIETIWGHLQSSNFKTGDYIDSRVQLGLTGNTGFCLPKGKGHHLHFGVREWIGGHCLNYNNGFKGWLDPATYDWGQWKEFLAVPQEATEADKCWNWGIDSGLTNGDRRNDPATREEVIVILNRFAKHNNLK